MTRDLEYKFSELEIGGVYIEGRADIEFDRDGDWHLANVVSTRIEDRDGDNVMDSVRITDAALRAAIVEQRGHRIQDCVLEELIWSDSSSDHGCWQYHNRG